MRIVVESAVPEIEGEETIVTVENATVESVILGFCVERRLPPSLLRLFSLQTPGGEVLAKKRTIAECGLRDGSTLLLVKDDPFKVFACTSWCFLSVLSLVVGLFGVVLVIVLYANSGSYPIRYAIVVDGGSTHTSVFVYAWHGNKYIHTGVVSEIGSKACEGRGLASYARDPQAAGNLVSLCLEYASHHVPQEVWAQTSLFIGTTAGMRLLDIVDHNASQALLSKIGERVEADFTFNDTRPVIRILHGNGESFFTWLSTNFIMDRLVRTYPTGLGWPDYKSQVQTPPPTPVGALDLGGASLQIGFATDTPIPKDHRENFDQSVVFGKSYNVYRHAFLCYGKNEAERQMAAFLAAHENNTLVGNGTVRIANPCMPIGNETTIPYDFLFGASQFCTRSITPPKIPVVVNANVTANSTSPVRTDSHIAFATTPDNFTFYGTSLPQQCAANVEKLFRFRSTECQWANESCSINGTFQPPIAGRNITAYSGFYYVMRFFNMTGDSSHNSTHGQAPPTAGHVNRTAFTLALKRFCALNYTETLKVAGQTRDSSTPYLMHYCFDGYYILGLLDDGFGFGNATEARAWDSIRFLQAAPHNAMRFGWSLGYAVNTSLGVPEDPPNYTFPGGLFAMLLLLALGAVVAAGGFAWRAIKERHRYDRYEQMPDDTYGSIS